MGKKGVHALQKRYLKMYKRKMAGPELPKGVKQLIEKQGFEVPKTATMKDFYQTLGLTSDPNANTRIGFNDKLGKLHEEQKKKAEAALPKPEEKIPFSKIMEELPPGEKYKGHLNENDFKICANLKTRYGDDYEMMAADIRRNPWQWTVRQLQKKFEIYDREVAEVTEEIENYEKTKEKLEREANGEEEEEETAEQ